MDENSKMGHVHCGSYEYTELLQNSETRSAIMLPAYGDGNYRSCSKGVYISFSVSGKMCQPAICLVVGSPTASYSVQSCT